MSHNPAPAISQVRRFGDVVVVDVQGDIDLSRSVEFQQTLLRILDEKPSRMVINLEAVPYMDSSGVASLVKVLSRARRANTLLVLASLSPRVRNLLEITRLDSVFKISANEQDALA